MILVLCILFARVLLTLENAEATRPVTLSVPSDSGDTTDRRITRRRRPPRPHALATDPAAQTVLHTIR
jgi:hypothetical protein